MIFSISDANCQLVYGKMTRFWTRSASYSWHENMSEGGVRADQILHKIWVGMLNMESSLVDVC